MRASIGTKTVARVATTLVVALAACSQRSQPPVAAGPSAADSADQVFITMHSALTTRGIQRGEVTADTAYVMNEQTRFDLRNAHAKFTTETGAPQGTMDAKRGVYNTRTQLLEGWGDVVVKLVDGRMLKSPHVIYNQMSHQISSDTTYTIYRGADSQHGIGFTSNETFSRFQCMKACGGSTSILLPEK
ncbi:MAG TPA: LPS export ABC transporter periplasmic protein LptC [Gemmatimonadaceae bacterium]|nr:LPS export ABC transporter periplasmic protein LptC [Gemmatimonadaceae bacterium]